MSHLSPEMRAYYAERAPYYDAVYSKPERKQDIAFLREELPSRFRDRKVLEVACGTGYWTQHIAKSAAHVTATDATKEPLEFARLRPNTENTEFRQVDAYSLSEDVGRFDAAFAGLWFSHVPLRARESFIVSLHSRLEDGAIVVFIDNSSVQCHDYPIEETDSDGNTYQIRELRDGSRHRVLKNFPSEEELRSFISAFGAVREYRALDNFWFLAYEV